MQCLQKKHALGVVYSIIEKMYLTSDSDAIEALTRTVLAAEATEGEASTSICGLPTDFVTLEETKAEYPNLLNLIVLKDFILKHNEKSLSDLTASCQNERFHLLLDVLLIGANDISLHGEPAKIKSELKELIEDCVKLYFENLLSQKSFEPERINEIFDMNNESMQKLIQLYNASVQTTSNFTAVGKFSVILQQVFKDKMGELTEEQCRTVFFQPQRMFAMSYLLEESRELPTEFIRDGALRNQLAGKNEGYISELASAMEQFGLHNTETVELEETRESYDFFNLSSLNEDFILKFYSELPHESFVEYFRDLKLIWMMGELQKECPETFTEHNMKNGYKNRSLKGLLSSVNASDKLKKKF